jgi:hypothetical protein
MKRTDYPAGYWKGKVDDETGMREICLESGWYVYVQKITISVTKAASGGGGEIILKDAIGTEIWKTDADSTKDIYLDFGDEGFRTSNTGLQVISANAATSQAEAWVMATGYKSFQDKK